MSLIRTTKLLAAAIVGIIISAANAPTASAQGVTLPELVPGTAMTWRDGGETWARNPFCKQAGFLLKAGSAAIDKAAFVAGHHCPKPGSALDQPKMADGSFCREWYGAGVDIGACEFVKAGGEPLPGLPAAPSGFTVTP